MKKFVFFMFLIAVSSLCAKQVEISKAANVAKNLVFERLDFAKNSSIKDEGTLKEDDIDVIYYFNFEPEGWALVSAHDNVYPILAYGDDGEFHYEDDNPAAKMFIENYKSQIKWAVENNQVASGETNDYWNRLSVDPLTLIREEARNVDNLLVKCNGDTIEWGQCSAFNQSCPEDVNSVCGNNHVPAGCVAVAMGQIMYYWEHPNIGQGDHSYQSDYSPPAEYADFGNTEYQFDQMSPSTGNIHSQTLLYHCGVSVDMNYGSNGSSAIDNDACDAFEDYFRYNPSANYLSKTFYTTSQWEEVLREELNNSRPVYYRASDLIHGGHAFVCSGWSGEHEFYFNWGQYGSDDGFFTLDDLTPGNHNYCLLEEIIRNIEPLYDNIEIAITNNTIPEIIPYVGGDFSINIENTGNENVILEFDYPSWCSVSQSSNDFTLSPQESNNFMLNTENNNSSQGRGGQLVISQQAGPTLHIINLYQEGENIPPASLTNGYVTPNPGTAGNQFTFNVTYTDESGNYPENVILHLTTQDYQMTHILGSPSTGAIYTYEASINNNGIFAYHFEANSGQQRYPEMIGEFLSLNVNESSIGWDVSIMGFEVEPTYLTSGGNVYIDANIFNDSDPGNTYADLYWESNLYNQNGSLIDQDIGHIYNFDLGVENVLSTLAVTNNNGIYSVSFTIYPELDIDFSDNSYTQNIIVSPDGQEEQYFFNSSNLYFEWFAPPSAWNSTEHDFNGQTFHLHKVASDYIDVSLNGNWPDAEEIEEHDFHIFGNSVIFVQDCDSSNDVATVDFGSQNTNTVEFVNNHISGFKGESISFVANSTTYEFDDHISNIFRNDEVDSWENDVILSNNNLTASFNFQVPNSAPTGLHEFWMTVELDNNDPSLDHYFLRKLTITVLELPPNISSLSQLSFSADDELTISGSYLGSNGSLYFGSILCPTENIDWSNTNIICIVPEGIQNDALYVTNSIGTSNSVAYSVISSTGDPEVGNPIPDQSLTAGQSRIIADLDNVFYDPNNDELIFTISGNDQLFSYQLNDENELIIEAVDNVTEVTDITISATDADNVSVSDTFTLSIIDINDAPTINLPDNFTFYNNETYSVNFNEYITDVDNDILILNVTGNIELNIDIDELMVEFSAPIGWTGTETTTFTVSDEVSRIVASDEVTIIVLNVTTPFTPPSNLAVESLAGGDAMFTWAPPAEVGEWIHYDDGMNDAAIGLTNGGNFIVAARWDVGDLDDYDGLNISKINLYFQDANCTLTAKVWTGANAGTEILSQAITAPVSDSWNEVIFDTPITIDSSVELWIGYSLVGQVALDYPAGTDVGPAITGYGDMINTNGTSWDALSILLPSLDYNWNIQAFVAGATRAIELPAPGNSIDNNLVSASTQNIFAHSNIAGSNNNSYNLTRELQGYNVYLDDVMQNLAGEVVTETEYLFTGLVDGTTYEAGVVSVYDEGYSDMVTLNFTYVANLALVADAGNDQVVRDGVVITLDGSGSYDPDMDPITYAWTAPAGITLDDPTAESPTFTAPEVTDDTNYSFTLVVSDAEDNNSDEVVITVQQDEPMNVEAFLLAYPHFVQLTWEAPGIGAETGEWIHYDDDTNNSGIGLATTGGSFMVAARWAAGDLDDYDGLQITKMSYVPLDATSTYTLKVWTGANATNEILSQSITNPAIGAWNEVFFTDPITIDSSEDLWIGYAVDQPLDVYPAGCDAGPAIAGFGDMISMGDGSWDALSSISTLDYNWNIQAWVSGADGPLPVAVSVASETPEAPQVSEFLSLQSNEIACGNLDPASSNTRDERSFLLGFYVYLDGIQHDEDLLDIDDTSYIYMNMTGDHSYGVAAVYNDGMSDIVSLDLVSEDISELPVVTALTGNYPNPFNPETNIIFELAADEFVSIEVYNIKGQKIDTVLDQQMTSGTHSVIWNADGQNSGIYFIHFETESYSKVSKAILLK